MERTPQRHPLAFQARRPAGAFRPRYIDERTGPTITRLRDTTTALSNISDEADEATGRTRNIYIQDPTPSGRTREYETIGTSRAAQIPDVARGGRGRPSTATTINARITEETAGVDSYKKGGMVKKTGLAYLHKGEMVVPKKDVNKVKKAMKGK